MKGINDLEYKDYRLEIVQLLTGFRYKTQQRATKRGTRGAKTNSMQDSWIDEKGESLVLPLVSFVT